MHKPHVIASICKQTDKLLWDAYALSQSDNVEDIGSGSLLFPRYQNKQGKPIRVSEQEARFAFVESISRSSLLYSVEAPTKKLYQFSGKTPMSAQTDLTLYDQTRQQICNVEFKAKGISTSAKNHNRIYKDFEKLLREPTWGLWFHLLESVNNSTINDILRVINLQICEVQKKFESDVESIGFTIHICVLQHGFSLQKDLAIPSERLFDSDELQATLGLDLLVSRTELLQLDNLNGWKLHKHHK